MRLQVSRSSDIAVRALLWLHQHGGRAAGGALAEGIGTSTSFLPQVLQPLLRRGWIDSTKGPGGGYALRGSLAEISMLDVVEAVEGPTDVGACVLVERDCSAALPCPLHDAWSAARGALTDRLGSTVLSGLHLSVDHGPAVNSAKNLQEP